MTVSALVAVLAIGQIASGCGGDERDGPGPAAALRQLQAAFVERDLIGICERLTRAAQRQAGSVAHGRPTQCRPDLRRALEIVEEGGRWGSRPSVARVRTSGDRAKATLTQKGRWAAEVPLAWEDGSWKLAGFFGAAPGEFERIDRTHGARPFPDVEGGPVEVVDGDGDPCRELSDARYPEVSGGCTFDASAAEVPVRMLTPFGDFKFADCSLDYRVFVDSRGRTWTWHWDVDGSSLTGCADVEGCYAEEGLRPWKGRLVSDGRGGFLHHVDMCVETCIGLFAGSYVTRLVRRGGRWRIEPTEQGATGFKIDGDLRIDGDAFDVRPR